MEEKSWDEIIPQFYLAKMEEEEKAREQLQLYLPPRRRHVQVGPDNTHPFALCNNLIASWTIVRHN